MSDNYIAVGFSQRVLYYRIQSVEGLIFVRRKAREFSSVFVFVRCLKQKWSKLQNMITSPWLTNCRSTLSTPQLWWETEFICTWFEEFLMKTSTGRKCFAFIRSKSPMNKAKKANRLFSRRPTWTMAESLVVPWRKIFSSMELTFVSTRILRLKHLIAFSLQKGTIVFFHIEEWKVVSKFDKHKVSIQRLFPETFGTSLALIDQKGDGFVYNVVSFSWEIFSSLDEHFVELFSSSKTRKSFRSRNFRQERNKFYGKQTSTTK